MNKYQAFVWLLNCTDEQLKNFLETYYFTPDIVFPDFIWAYQFLTNTFGEGDGIKSVLY